MISHYPQAGAPRIVPTRWAQIFNVTLSSLESAYSLVGPAYEIDVVCFVEYYSTSNPGLASPTPSMTWLWGLVEDGYDDQFSWH